MIYIKLITFLTDSSINNGNNLSSDEQMDTVEKKVINKALYDSKHRLISISTHLIKHAKKTRNSSSKFKSKRTKVNSNVERGWF
jgi:hypothetical protein